MDDLLAEKRYVTIPGTHVIAVRTASTGCEVCLYKVTLHRIHDSLTADTQSLGWVYVPEMDYDTPPWILADVLEEREGRGGLLCDALRSCKET